MSNPLNRILEWLRTGYPNGVPPTDFYPLLALLTRDLSEDEVEQILASLSRENPDGPVTEADVQGAISRVTASPATEDHTREVAERLADAGRPITADAAETDLASAADTDAEESEHSSPGSGATTDAPMTADGESESESESEPPSTAAPVGTVDPEAQADRSNEVTPNAIQRILDWLSAGYPAGIPAKDRIPLLALLRRQLTDDEAKEIASHLVDEAGRRIVDPTDAGVAITRYTNDLPTEQEMRRVAEHLAEQGWPLGDRR